MAEREDKDELDLNDPRWDETYEGDPEGDYNAFMVIPDGVHQAVVMSQVDNTGDTVESYGKPYTDRDGNDRTMLIAPLQVVIKEDGKPYTGQRIKDWATSLISFRSGTSTIGDICRLAGSPHAKGISTKALKKHFDDLIASEPPLRVKTEWQGSCEKCRKSYVEKNPDDLGAKVLKKASNDFAEKKSLRGMNRWPEDEKGGYKAEVACPDCGEDIQARPVVKKYLALK